MKNDCIGDGGWKSRFCYQEDNGVVRAERVLRGEMSYNNGTGGRIGASKGRIIGTVCCLFVVGRC
jgi:hypothetical protein